MAKIIPALIGLFMIVIFLGYYAISINSVPLWVIIGSILIMICVDFVRSMRTSNKSALEKPDHTLGPDDH